MNQCKYVSIDVGQPVSYGGGGGGGGGGGSATGAVATAVCAGSAAVVANVPHPGVKVAAGLTALVSCTIAGNEYDKARGK